MARRGCTTGPAAIRLSLLASPSRLPDRSVSTVTDRPAKPTTPLITTSAGPIELGLVSDDLDIREGGRDLGSPSLVGDRHDARPELAGLLDQCVGR